MDTLSADTLPARALSGDTRVSAARNAPPLLVPRELVGSHRTHLRIAGLAPLADETTVHSDPAAPEVVVMAVARACHPGSLGDRLAFTSRFTFRIQDLYGAPAYGRHPMCGATGRNCVMRGLAHRPKRTCWST
ncbi:MAG: hypothetical protein ACLS37_12145 [Alistipes sp.]